MTGYEMKPVSGCTQWLRIYQLYHSAFPRCERKPFSMIRSMWRRGRTDVWFCKRNGRFAGFATTINGDGLVLLDYLAVTPGLRGQGNGTYILAGLKTAYADRGLFVEIESPFEDVPDRELRMRRRRFYERSGFAAMGVMADVFGVRMELLGVGCCMDFDAYRAFYRAHYSDYAAQNIVYAPYPK